MNVYCVTNRTLCTEPFEERIKKICTAHPDGIILREKDLSDEAYTALALDIAAICADFHVPFIVNQNIGCAQNLHIPQLQLAYSLFLQNAETLQGNIGVSIHSVEEAVHAQTLGASYLIAGHIFPTDCKKGIPARGLSFLRAICKAVNIPVYAIGGIHTKNTGECIRAGAEGICLMSSLMRTDDPQRLIYACRTALKSSIQ